MLKHFIKAEHIANIVELKVYRSWKQNSDRHNV